MSIITDVTSGSETIYLSEATKFTTSFSGAHVDHFLDSCVQFYFPLSAFISYIQ